MINNVSIQVGQVVPHCCSHNARYMCFNYYGIVLQPTCVLCCGVRYCMLCIALLSHCNPYTPPHQTGHTPVDTTTTKRTN